MLAVGAFLGFKSPELMVKLSKVTQLYNPRFRGQSSVGLRACWPDSLPQTASFTLGV